MNHGGTINNKVWQGHGATLTLFFRSQPTENWKIFDTKSFSQIDPGRKLQKTRGSLAYTVDRAIDRSYNFKIVIDEKNNIPESNENNNKKELYLTCNLQALPLQHSKIRTYQGEKKDTRGIQPFGVHLKQPPEVPKRVPKY